MPPPHLNGLSLPVASLSSAHSVVDLSDDLWTMMTTFAPLLSTKAGQAVLSSVVSDLRSYLQSSGRRFDKRYYADLAVEASQHFQWPPEVCLRDLKRLRVAGSLPHTSGSGTPGTGNFPIQCRKSDSLSPQLPVVPHCPWPHPLSRRLINCHRTHV